MRYSVSLPRARNENGTQQIDDAIVLAQAVEAAGLDACAVTDHPFPQIGPGVAGHQSFDPFVLLAYIAGATSTLGLHFNLIVLPYRNPFLVARMLGTLDLASHHRVIASIGTGYLRSEFEALGADFESRQEYSRVGVEAMRAAWTGEPVSITTSSFTAVGNKMLPAPPVAPILWRGGNTRNAMEHAIADCDGWTPFEVVPELAAKTTTAPLSIDSLSSRIAEFRQSSHDAGKDLDFVSRSPERRLAPRRTSGT